MKNLIYTFVGIFFTTCLLSCGSEENSTVDKKHKNNEEKHQTAPAKPEDVEKNEKHVYKAPVELSYGVKKEGFSYDKFYPIGWSDDGKFAYVVEPADENSGLYFFEIHVYDVVNNRDLWSWKPEELEQGSVKSVWDENAEFLSQSLNEYNIEQTDIFKLQPSKISYKGNDYEIVMDSKLATDDDFGIDMVRGVKLTMKSSQLGNKDFYEQEIDNRDYILSAYIPGFLISPKNDRIAVIYQKERIGAGGPPNIVFFEIIGTNLSTGFVKDELVK